MKILITGGSGFIGSNLISSLLKNGCEILNIDIKKPLLDEHLKFYEFCDIREIKKLDDLASNFSPDYIIHLAARTDLNSDNLNEYDSNTLGVKNLCIVSAKLVGLKRVIFTSSMLVCKAGHIPQNEYDFSPDTCYGKSKVIGEEIVHEFSSSLPSYFIIRPTSIWGPMFQEPYRRFFDLVITNKFLDIGEKYCTKSYGYVGNVVNQIKSLLDCTSLRNGTVLYVGDSEPIQLSKWANLICKIGGFSQPFKVNYSFLRLLAFSGDFLKFLGISFPMTSFRLKNMTTDNIVDCSIASSINQYKNIQLDKAIEETLKWIRLSD